MNEYRYFIKQVFEADKDLVIVDLADSAGGPVFYFKPGQYVMISYKNAAGRFEDKHAFSIASAPTEKGILRLGIRIGGKFTQGLLSLKSGDEMLVAGPFGKFVFDEKKYLDTVFIAGGIGVTPFYSAIKYACDNNLSNKLSLLYSSRTLKGMAFFKELNVLEKNNANLSCLYSVTDEAGIGQGNIINQRFNEQNIKDKIGMVQGKTFFICGPAPFMTAIKVALKNIGAEDGQIMLEEFSMIPDAPFKLKTKSFAYAMSFSLAFFAIALYGISYSAAQNTVAKKNSFDLGQINKVNEAVLSRLEKITLEKNSAILALQKKLELAGATTSKTTTTTTTNVVGTSNIKAVTNTTSAPVKTTPVPVTSAPVKTNTPTPVNNTPAPAPAPVASTPAYVAPTPTPAPTPQTRTS